MSTAKPHSGPRGRKRLPRTVRWAVVACCAFAALGPAAANAAVVTGSVFNPTEFTALDAGGGLVLTAGDSLTFDTANLQLTGTIGGLPVNFSGVAAGSQGGGVELAVFTFSSINVGAGATVDVVGTRGLVLGSQSNFSLLSPIELSGSNGQQGASSAIGPGGAGGPGAEGGVRGTSWASNPPGLTRGYGGNGGLSIDTNSDGIRDTTDATPGVGYGGGGIAAITLTERAGGGGSYGGAGGNAPNTGGAGGPAYGDAALTELYGGSGGGGSQRQTYYNLGHGGGGGGGALELVAAGTLSIDSTLSLAGGAGGGSTAGSMVGGGGGSGGGVILAANQVHFGASGSIDVSGGAGGAGGDANRHGGGGGGGRVAVYAGSVTGTSNVTLSGGTATGNAAAGAVGTLHQTGYVHPTFVAPYVRIDFNDMSAGNVHGQAGGMGFSGTWSTAQVTGQQIDVVTGDLVAPASTNFRLTQSGTPQSLQGIDNNVSVQYASRSLTDPLAGTVWFSFLLEPTADGRGGIDLNTGRIISVGSTLFTQLPSTPSSTVTKSNVFTNFGETYLVLGKVDMDAGLGGEDYLRLWVNPDVTLGPDGLGTPTLENLGANWIGSGGITSLRIENYAGTAGNATPQIDLITVSSSPTAYLDVTGVPEPSALLLLAAAGAMLCGFRRRTRAS